MRLPSLSWPSSSICGCAVRRAEAEATAAAARLWMPAPDDQRLRLRHAAALGLLHGPAELLPISSSGHVTLVPWLLRWPYSDLDPELRKSYEVALHAGTALGLL